MNIDFKQKPFTLLNIILLNMGIILIEGYT